MLSGKFTLKIPLDDDIDMLVEAFNFQGGQYKKLGDKTFAKFCASLYNDFFGNIYAKMYEASKVKIPFGTCPYPAGENEFTNLMFTDNGMLPPYIPGGEKWRLDFRFLKNGEVLGGYNAYIIIRSERSLLLGG